MQFINVACFRAFNAGADGTGYSTILRSAELSPKSHLETAFLTVDPAKNRDRPSEKSVPTTNTRAVSGSEDGSLLFFDIERSWKPCVDKLSGHLKPVVSVAFSDDERYLASADTSGQIIVWKKS